MGTGIKTGVVLLFDNYGLDSKNLHTSFKMTGKEYPVAVIDDDGFLPDDVTSVYGYFLGEFITGGEVYGKPRYFNQIQVPEYWEISGNNSNGKVHNLNKERARIFYAEPKHKRLVKVVDWLDERGIVRSSDHYNKYGALYARTTFNAKGQKVNKTYFSGDGKEVIVENYVTKDIILNEGNVVTIFHTKKDFVAYFMRKNGWEKHRIFFNTLSTSFFVSQALAAEHKEDVLFWQEPIKNDIPGNMKIILDGSANRTTKIMVQKKEAYDKMVELGAPTSVIAPLGYIYPFNKENGHTKNVLICTNSDRIAQCQKLVEAMPDMHFYIAALTEMSSKLMSMEAYENVSLYPGVKIPVLDELFETCDYYFDINHESEIVSAVQMAFLHNHLIYGFKETLHNANYIAPAHIFSIEDADALIAAVKETMADGAKFDKEVKLQHAHALLEDKETYLGI